MKKDMNKRKFHVKREVQNGQMVKILMHVATPRELSKRDEEERKRKIIEGQSSANRGASVRTVEGLGEVRNSSQHYSNYEPPDNDTYIPPTTQEEQAALNWNETLNRASQ